MKTNRIEKISLRPEVRYWTTYKNENYEVKDVLAELIDNSYSSYIKNKKILFENNPNYKLKISIFLDTNEKQLMVFDNAFGMNLEELKNGIKLQSTQDLENKIALNEHGLGLKKAAIWIADKFKIETKKFNCKYQNNIEIDHNKLKQNIDENFIEEFEYDGNIKDSFTRITFSNLNKNIFKKFDFKSFKKLIHEIKDIYRKILKDKNIELRFAIKKYNGFGYATYINLSNKENCDDKLDLIEPIKIDEELKYVLNIDKEKLYKWDFNKEFEVLNDFDKWEKFNIFGNIGITDNWLNWSKDKIFKPGIHFFRNNRKVSYFSPNKIFNISDRNIERIYGEINISDNFQTITTKNKIKWIGDLEEQFLKFINEFSIDKDFSKIFKSLKEFNEINKHPENNEKIINEFKKQLKNKKSKFKDFKLKINDDIDDTNQKPIEIDKIKKEIKINSKNKIFKNLSIKEASLLNFFILNIIEKIKETNDEEFLKKFLEIIK